MLGAPADGGSGLLAANPDLEGVKTLDNETVRGLCKSKKE